MATITLSTEELQLLLRHLTRHIAELDAALVHTDRPALQHDLAREIDAIRAIERRFAEAAR